jgi:hypothetical protein
VSLKGQQGQFVVMVGSLISYATIHGYVLRFGDAWRSTDALKCPHCAVPHSYQDMLVFNGRSHTKNSRHLDRLAVDFVIERANGDAMDDRLYDTLGNYWEANGGRWGGRWKARDLGHFELVPV